LGKFDTYKITPPAITKAKEYSGGEFVIPLTGAEGNALLRLGDLSPIGSFTSLLIPGKFERPFSFKIARKNPDWTISLHFKYQGSSDLRLPGVAKMGFVAAPAFQAFLVSSGEAEMFVEAPSGYRSFSVAISVDWIVENIGLEAVPKALRNSFEKRKFDRMMRWDLKNTPAVMRLRREFAGNPYFGGTERIYIQARMLDALAEFFSQIAGEEEGANRPNMLERMRLMEAWEELAASAGQPPALDKIARGAGMSVKKFSASFRTLFGQTPFIKLREHRLDEARAAIIRGDININEAASIAGYSHTSSFIAAYRRRYGSPPGSQGKSF